MLHNKDTFEDISKIRKLYWKNNMDKIVNYFMNIKESKFGKIKILLAQLHFTFSFILWHSFQ